MTMAGQCGADARYPLVGAFEADAWAGLVVAVAPQAGLAVRVVPEIDGRRLEPASLFHCVHEVGPCDPDGRFARVSFDLREPLPPSPDTPIRRVADGEATLTWAWTCVGDGVAATVSVARPMRVWFACGNPWDWPGRWAMVEGLLHARLANGEVLRMDLADGRAGVACEVDADERSARLAVDVEPGAPVTLRIYDFRKMGTVPKLQTETSAIVNNVHWMVLLQPETMRRYVPAGRRWMFPTPDGGRDDWTVFEWDAFFNALLLSIESPTLAAEMLDTVLATQYPNGNVPNWRSRRSGTRDRSQPPIGAFIVLKLWHRTGDRSFVDRTLPALDRWHAWWSAPKRGWPRRQRPSGLFAWGSDLDEIADWVPPWERDATHRQKAAWESGQDDLPNWDDVPWDDQRETLALECVDLSALLALDAECLAVLHMACGDPEQATAYRREWIRLASLINTRLWDASRGFYVDRREDGTFSPHLAASNVLPLLAGVVPADRRARVLDVLLDPRRFWGEWIVPTISRDDPAFPDQQYWRGTIWPPMNFLLYEGLRRVSADAAAARLAGRSAALFVDDWRAHQVCRENFSSVDGQGGGQRHQSWGPLFAWTHLSEGLDVTPWEGLRIGSAHVDAPVRLDDVAVAGHRWSVDLRADGIAVTRDGHPMFFADGPVCLRHVRLDATGWSATATTTNGTTWHAGDGAIRTLAPGTTRIHVP